jgi:hypothetical protein
MQRFRIIFLFLGLMNRSQQKSVQTFIITKDNCAGVKVEM